MSVLFLCTPARRCWHGAVVPTAAALILLALLAPDTASAQCSMCRTALEQNPEAAAGFNRAILFLLAAPYAVFGSLAGYVIASRRRARAESAEGVTRGSS